MSNKLIVMVLMTATAVFGGLTLGPFIPLIAYYFFAVMRPQYIWKYELPADIQWSFVVAVVAMAATVIARCGLMYYPTYGPTAGARRPGWNRVHWLLLAFALWVCLSYQAALSQTRAWPFFIEYVKMFVMFLVAALVVQRVNQLWTILIVLALADIYIAWEINFFYFSTGYMYLQNNGFGGLDNNGAGLMLAMGIPLCYFLWEGTAGRVRWLFLAAMPVIAHAVMLSFSRGAMLSILLAAPWLFFFSSQKKKVALAYVLGGAFVLATAGPELQARFFSISSHEIDESANSRKQTWMIAVRMANEHPILGLGVRCSTLKTREYGADMEGRAIHSQYLQTAADCGWVGMALFVALLVMAVWQMTVFFRRTRHWPRYPEVMRARAIAGAVVCSLMVYAVGGVFLSLDNFELPYVLFLVSAQMFSIYKAGGVEAMVWQSMPPRYAPLPPRPPRPPRVPATVPPRPWAPPIPVAPTVSG